MEDEGKTDLGEDSDELQFWIITNPEVKPFGEITVAVVDEELGGIIAYFANLDDAREFCNMMDKAGG